MRQIVRVVCAAALVVLASDFEPAPADAQAPQVQTPAALPPGQAPTAADLDGLNKRLQALEGQQIKQQGQLLELTDRLNALLGAPAKEQVFIIPPAESAIRGNPAAPVTLVVFGDYQSGYTARSQAVVQQLLEEFPTQLRYLFKQFPLSDRNAQANEAALSAISAQRQGKFWEMHDALFRNSRRLDPDLYLVLAQQIGLDLVRFQADRNSLWTLERLSDDQKLGARLNVDSVPAFFLNGRRMLTWRHDYLKDQIKRLLEN